MPDFKYTEVSLKHVDCMHMCWHTQNVQHVQETVQTKITLEMLFPLLNLLCNILERIKISSLLLNSPFCMNLEKNAAGCLGEL